MIRQRERYLLTKRVPSETRAILLKSKSNRGIQMWVLNWRLTVATPMPMML